MDALYYMTVKGCKNDSNLEKLNNMLEDMGIIGEIFNEGKFALMSDVVVFEPIGFYDWYDYDVQMREISSKFRFMKFKLEIIGVDQYVNYFVDGHSELCNGYIKYEEPEKIIW